MDTVVSLFLCTYSFVEWKNILYSEMVDAGLIGRKESYIILRSLK